ncbi:MAG: conjugal transfer protein TraD [Legionellaceae bacterium]|nr:conjugal transfer protein TraD [Legionellaceae bacterium]
MTMPDQITKQQQYIARCEKSLALEKLKKRRADTRRKIELGGLVIKSGMDGYNKAVILGALLHAMQLLNDDEHHVSLFESIGNNAFLRDS